MHYAVTYVTISFILLSSTSIVISNDFPDILNSNISHNISKSEKLTTSLEEIVKTSEEAYIIWNITQKYDLYDARKTKDICIAELHGHLDLTAVYLFNLTFYSTESYLENYEIKEFDNYVGNELKFARKLYEKRIDVLNDMEQYFTTFKNIYNRNGNDYYHSKELICISRSSCGCVKKSYLETFDVELEVFKIVLWTWCIFASLPFLFVSTSAVEILKLFIYVLLYVLVLPIVLAVVITVTARKLQRVVEKGDGANSLKNIAGSGLVFSLTAVFYLTHMPFFVFNLYENLADWMYTDLYSSAAMRIFVFIFHLMNISYPCVNVIVMYKASGTYRCFLNEYIFRCWYNPQDRQYVTMTSVQSTGSNANDI
ncbi:hypothetical protein L9F63_021614 [Diploptera punctata]|uniref:G-protein coupled receptors family 1 profile domain-containing protein n=1 Tax=Diploptera punctata TaxID=6984 RepID=A0AAD8EBU6_DIPPU|nr:hypothetical protein L9F63_021614 [Diploptera punctata]